uniref:Uncharacterized protein n=1 Tax=Romanomermis culicivorax TaxID=13658 RepID=A0A915J977_ROMCU
MDSPKNRNLLANVDQTYKPTGPVKRSLGVKIRLISEKIAPITDQNNVKTENKMTVIQVAKSMKLTPFFISCQNGDPKQSRHLFSMAYEIDDRTWNELSIFAGEVLLAFKIGVANIQWSVAKATHTRMMPPQKQTKEKATIIRRQTLISLMILDIILTNNIISKRLNRTGALRPPMCSTTHAKPMSKENFEGNLNETPLFDDFTCNAINVLWRHVSANFNVSLFCDDAQRVTSRIVDLMLLIQASGPDFCYGDCCSRDRRCRAVQSVVEMLPPSVREPLQFNNSDLSKG